MSTFLRPLINPQIVVGSTRLQPVGRINQAAARRQEQPGSSPFSGSTRQQTFGTINQVSDCGDGGEGEDEDKGEDEIPSYAVLLTASVERFGVSSMRDFY